MRSISIAVCDDDKMALSMVSGALKSALRASGVEVKSAVFLTPQKFLKSLESTEYDMAFLDIDMPGMDGIELGKKLRKDGRGMEIVYVSNCETRVFEAFEVHPFGFIRKSRFLKDMTDVIRLYLEAHKEERPSRMIDLPARYGSRVNLKIDDILYFEGNGIYQNAYMKAGDIMEVASQMAQLEETLAEYGFMRIHKGYLVNYQHIVRIDSAEVAVSNGTMLPISRRKSKDIKNQYLMLNRKNGALMF